MEGGVGKERGRGRWEKRKKTAGGQGGKAVKREREGEEGRKNEAQNTKQNESEQGPTPQSFPQPLQVLYVHDTHNRKVAHS